MLTKEEYDYVNGYRGILELFYNTGEYVGGANDLIAWHERRTGETIDRGCKGCLSGFLKFSYSLLKQYDNGSTKG